MARKAIESGDRDLRGSCRLMASQMKIAWGSRRRRQAKRLLLYPLHCSHRPSLPPCSSPSMSKGIALVTGAAHGIGRDIALRLADDGFDVGVNDIAENSALLDTLVREIKQKGRDSTKYIGDVSEEEVVKDMIDEVAELLGGLDVMVANAGVAGPYGAKITELSGEQWDRVMNINARGTFLCYKHAGAYMVEQGRGGHIIGASSIAGKKGMATQAVYSASKYAVRGLTQAAAMEFGPHGINVNAYAPGAIETTMLTGGTANPEQTAALLNRFKDLSPLGTIGSTGDIAGLVSFLASNQAQFITGQSISINGGLFFD
ncbi:acetoin reductase family protein [Mycena vitilis]|nr:acetoin reductase family protein [Mycena vitilis]